MILTAATGHDINDAAVYMNGKQILFGSDGNYSFIVTENAAISVSEGMPQTYRVTYEPNGGEGYPTDDASYKAGSTVNLIFEDLPYRDHYTFLGWDEDADIDPYEDAIDYTALNPTMTMPEKDVTLYAIWGDDITPVIDSYGPETDEVEKENEKWSYTVMYDGYSFQLTALIEEPNTEDSYVQPVYTWYRVVEGEPVLLEGENTGSITLKNVDDSGEYYCEVNYLKGETHAETTISYVVNITPAPLTITAEDIEIYYGEELPSITVEGIGYEWSGFVGGETESVIRREEGFITSDYELGDEVGSYNLTIDVSKLIPDHGNYSITSQNATLTVVQRPVVLTEKASPLTVHFTVATDENALREVILANLNVEKYYDKQKGEYVGGLAELLDHTIENLDLQLDPKTLSDSDDITITIGNNNYCMGGEETGVTIEIRVTNVQYIAEYTSFTATSARITLWKLDEEGNRTQQFLGEGDLRCVIYRVNSTDSDYANETPVVDVIMTKTRTEGVYIARYSRLTGSFRIFAIPTSDAYSIVDGVK